MRATYVDLIEDVRAQIDVDEDTAFSWLLDRARVLNAEVGWSLREGTFTSDGSRAYPLPQDSVWVEAVLIGSTPYQRSTLHAMDARWSPNGNQSGIYAYYIGPDGAPWVQIHPPVDSAVVTVRYVADVADDRSQPAPFPPDFDQVLVDGAIGIGMARMDERFDSAGYFNQRFADGLGRLRRRRHGGVGRGATAIRIGL